MKLLLQSSTMRDVSSSPARSPGGQARSRLQISRPRDRLSDRRCPSAERHRLTTHVLIAVSRGSLLLVTFWQLNLLRDAWPAWLPPIGSYSNASDGIYAGAASAYSAARKRIKTNHTAGQRNLPSHIYSNRDSRALEIASSDRSATDEPDPRGAEGGCGEKEQKKKNQRAVLSARSLQVISRTIFG